MLEAQLFLYETESSNSGFNSADKVVTMDPPTLSHHSIPNLYAVSKDTEGF